ncbi:hypothetical protein LXL04_007832 [Taraxacum kok-saghyz]
MNFRKRSRGWSPTTKGYRTMEATRWVSRLQHTPVLYRSYTSRKEQKKNEEANREGKEQSQRREEDPHSGSSLQNLTEESSDQGKNDCK